MCLLNLVLVIATDKLSVVLRRVFSCDDKVSDRSAIRHQHCHNVVARLSTTAFPAPSNVLKQSNEATYTSPPEPSFSPVSAAKSFAL